MNATNVCNECMSTVTNKQEGLICDICVRWFHRKCFNGTTVGMSRPQYRLLKSRDVTFDWKCLDCYTKAEDHQQQQRNDSTIHLAPPTNIPRLVDYSDSECSEISPIPMTEEIFTFPVGCSGVVESSIEASVPRDISSENAETTFVVEGDLSQRKHPKLYERHGYSYTVLRTNINGSVTWRCSVRRKGNICPAKVYQTEDDFSRNGLDHTHEPRPNERPRVLLNRAVLKRGLENPYTACGIITKAARRDMTNPPSIRFTNEGTLKRFCNRKRQGNRPTDPSDINDELKIDYLPTDFLLKDIRIEGARHLLFATQKQLKILANSKVWYMDGTFDVVRDPYYQLFSIHAFVRSGECTKQLPLVFVLMSRRRKCDYENVFKAIKTILHLNFSGTRVKKFVMDFEAATWQALSLVWPDVRRQGCAFHFTQAIMKNMRQNKLASLYNKDIPSLFLSLRGKMTTDGLNRFAEYFDRTWLKNSVWKPKDCLISKIHEVSIAVESDVAEVMEENIPRRADAKYSEANDKLKEVWSVFKDGGLSAEALLRRCSKIYGPAFCKE
uniref:uncharacterized protein LOC120337663 n=1 Tax=Styela clava TaxID=7725 RepID=UPI0019392C14|nr:uncharacterized protein LOC120337663 [Styela clava]